MATSLTGPVRVRFAPSPTGYLHVGGARTAIYNELLRANLGGAHILRIEDTDRERSDDRMTRQIEEALRWVGVTWDEGPFLQSAHLSRHQEVATRFLAEGSAYRCFLSTEEADVLRQEAFASGRLLRDVSPWARATAAEGEAEAATGRPFSIRFRMPTEPITFRDLVRGDMAFPPETLEDFIVLRSDGTPTYHLSVVVDDVDMGVTHVIRGEDHLSNTPKHIAMFRALGAAVPTFAHLPMILGSDKKRLSKRTGATSVEEFRDRGIVPEALYNYLVLLGWAPGDGREVMSKDEIVAAFTVERLGSSAAVFDVEKLLWMNSQYLWAMEPTELRKRGATFLAQQGLGDEDPARLEAAIGLWRLRARTLVEHAEGIVPVFQAPTTWPAEDNAKFVADAALPARLRALASAYAGLEAFDLATTEAALRALAEGEGLKAAALIHPLRMALTAAKGGPPLFDVVVLLGAGETAARLERFASWLETPQADQPHSG
jgi:glutamyl-tRNA synthetase